MQRRDSLLAALGVVQYRKRDSALVDNEQLQHETSAGVADELLGSSDAQQTSQKPNANKSGRGVQAAGSMLLSPETDESVTATDTATEVKALEQPEEGTARSEVSASAPEELGLSDATRKFDLAFWKAGNLLVLETSRDEQSLADTKHRLANNVLRAIFGASVGSSSMHSQTWPIHKAKSDDKAAEEWLRVFLKGHQNQNPGIRIWLMGEDIAELLLSKQGELQEIQGMQIQDDKLDCSLFITASLGDMIKKPYLKAPAWQLLKALCP